MAEPVKPQKQLSLLDSTTIIMGSMIGSGIFIVSAEIARQVETPGMLLLAWIVTGIITLLGALSYGELAAAMPKAGGQYVYLREAYGPLPGFLYGWTLFSVIQTGTIAAVAVAFAKFTGVFFPAVSNTHIIFDAGIIQVTTQQLLAVAVIILLSVYNFKGVKAGAVLQNIFTITKVAALMMLIAMGLYFGLNNPAASSHFKPVFPDIITLATIGMFGAALTGSLFSADAWNNITYTAGEVKNPQRNLPRALAIGTGTVLLLYFLANVAYLFALPIEEIKAAENDRVGTTMMKAIVGDAGKYVMAALIMVSTFGCLNGIIFTAPRVYYAMAKDRLFLRKAAALNAHGVPANSITMQCIWSCLLCFSGTYSELLNYIMFATMLFYILTISGLFVLRMKKPDMERPYKTVGYPLVPLVYIVLALLVCLNMLIYQSKQSLFGLIIIAVGIPVFYFLKKRNSREKTVAKG